MAGIGTFSTGQSSTGGVGGKGGLAQSAQNKTATGGQSASSPANADALKSLATQISQPSQPSTPAPALTNNSTTNPTVDGTVLPALLARAQGGMGAPEAIRLATGATRDALSGILKETGQMASRRGVGGTGAEDLIKSNAVGNAQRQIAGQSADISYKAEQDRNALYGNIAGIAQNSDQMQNEQRRINLSQWEAGQNQANVEQNRSIERDNQLIRILTTPGLF